MINLKAVIYEVLLDDFVDHRIDHNDEIKNKVTRVMYPNMEVQKINSIKESTTISLEYVGRGDRSWW